MSTVATVSAAAIQAAKRRALNGTKIGYHAQVPIGKHRAKVCEDPRFGDAR
jgi:hypothetical protein